MTSTMPFRSINTHQFQLERIADCDERGLIDPLIADAHGLIVEEIDRRSVVADSVSARALSKLCPAVPIALVELMKRLGHSDVQAALIYEHATADRDAELARKLSDMTGG